MPTSSPSSSHSSHQAQRHSSAYGKSVLSGQWWLLWVLASLAVHMALMTLLSSLPSSTPRSSNAPAQKTQDPPQMIVDVIQGSSQTSEKPPDTTRLGYKDHHALQDTTAPPEEGFDAGQHPQSSLAKSAKTKHELPPPSSSPSTSLPPSSSSYKGSTAPHIEGIADLPHSTAQPAATHKKQIPPIEEPQQQPDAFARTPYEELLSHSADGLADTAQQNYAAFIEDPTAHQGQSIDLSTQEFRWMGYFSKLKKTIQSTWSYPRAARYAALQGRVKVRFIILKNGDLAQAKVLSSSGYDILDAHVLQALGEAAPFDPLPWHFKEPRMEVTGVFTYLVR